MERYPNLRTVMMVEDLLRKIAVERPVSVAWIRRELPKQVMHQTLHIVLDYLRDSRKIEYGRGGSVRWVFNDSS